VKIVVALDKFKGTLSAPRACRIVRDALLAARPDLQVVVKPMADGGDGTAEVLRTALGGRWIFRKVSGPLPGMRVTARYLWVAGRKLAVIEMAAASGLALLAPEQRDPLRATTFGTGELIRDAMERGARKILLAVGGSATVDGGVGAAMALGWKFFDRSGKPPGFGGGRLERIGKIEPPGNLRLPAIEVLCDVYNPLCGRRGAARVFGPQKGATPAMVARLDAGLRHLAAVVKAQLGKHIANEPGAGAAGGLAFGAMAFMNARLLPGVEAVMEATGLAGELRDADWVITGEGSFDAQSLRGKVVSGLAKLARAAGVKVAVVAGRVELPRQLYRRAGIELAVATMRPGMALERALQNAGRLLAAATRKLAGQLCGAE
jgi:glycerate kinase